MFVAYHRFSVLGRCYNTNGTWWLVKIFSGESPAAMQTGSAGFSRNYVTMGLIVSVGYTLSVCYVRFQVDSMRGVVQR